MALFDPCNILADDSDLFDAHCYVSVHTCPLILILLFLKTDTYEEISTFKKLLMPDVPELTCLAAKCFYCLEQK